MQQLLVHIGTHKTGTTAIQNALRANSKLLAQNGCAYIDEAYELSRRLKNTFSEHSVSVIAYFRRQDHFIESAYTQFIQQGQPWSFDKFRDIADFSKFDWNRVVDNYRQYFQSVDIHIYDRSQLTGGDVVVDFFSWLGLPVDRRLRTIQGSNYSFSRTAVEIVRVGNDYLDDAAKEQLSEILQSQDSRQPYDDNLYFSMQERKALLAHYRAANQKLAAAAGADLEELFTRIPVAAPPGMETAATAIDSDAAVRQLIDICLQQHRGRRFKTMGSLAARLNNKLRQYVPW